MGKLENRLNKQLKTEYKKEAEDCIKIYNELKDLNNGKVWSSDWLVLSNVIFNNGRIYRPSQIGYIFLKGIEND